MAPKKPNRSPFGIFMLKMKRTDPNLRSMHVSQLVGHCAPLYDSLPQEVRHRLDQLSLTVRQLGLDDNQVNRRLDQLSLEENGGPTAHSSYSQNSVQMRGGGDCAPTRGQADKHRHNPELSLFKNTSDPKRFKDDEDFEEEEDTSDILQKAFEKTKDFPNQTIVGICFNVLVHTHEDKYYPNEVGITLFSLEDGVQRCYTKLIANEVPDGYYATAKQFSETFHKLPVNCVDNKDFVADYPKLFNDIYQLMSSSGLKDDRNRKIVFCKSEDSTNGQTDRYQVMGCLKWFDEKMRSLGEHPEHSLVDDFVIIAMSDLLYLTINSFCMDVRPKSLCIEELNRSIFDFHADLRCATHSVDENNYCALGVIKRTAFLFFNILFALQLKPELDIKVKPSHRPIKTDYKSITSQMVLSERPIFRPKIQYQCHIESPPEEPSTPQSAQLKRLNRVGLGRGRLLNNLNNLQNN